MLKKTYHIPDMHCTSCAMTLESIEDDLEGIKNIKASYHQHTLSIEFDENVVAEQSIIAAIKGIDYTPIPVDE